MDAVPPETPSGKSPRPAFSAVLFLVLCFAGLAAFSVRYVLRTRTGPAFRSRPAVRRLLAGGAPEIAGTPRPGRTFRAGLEWETTENVPFKVPLLEAACAWERLLRWNVPLLTGYNAVFDAGGGFLGRVEYASPDVRSAQCRATVGFLETVRRLFPETPILYAVTPARFGADDRFADGVFFFGNEGRDALASAVRSAGFDVLDLRRDWAETGRRNRDAFFRTDHHFTPETGVWAARRIGETLAERFGVPVDTNALADSAFRKDVRKGAFLGSMGKKFSLARCRPDDISVIGTDAPADFEIEVPARRLRSRGGSKALVDWTRLRGGRLYSDNPYAAYLHSDNPLVRVRNLHRPDGPGILVFGDSFDNALVTFLAAAAGRIETVDLRLGRTTPDDLRKDGPFDAVLVFWNEPPPVARLEAFSRESR